MKSRRTGHPAGGSAQSTPRRSRAPAPESVAPERAPARRAPDERRCPWCLADEGYINYHDEEWGRPRREERALYEKIVLEGFQAGLSWLTILRKRPAFRAAFADFDPARVARFTARDVTRLLGDAGIVRHRGKIESAINNARRVLELREGGGSLSELLWRFEPRRRAGGLRSLADAPASTPGSVALSRELRRLGWSFVGPTTMYAMMQAVGIVNDHLDACPWWEVCEEERKRLG